MERRKLSKTSTIGIFVIIAVVAVNYLSISNAVPTEPEIIDSNIVPYNAFPYISFPPYYGQSTYEGGINVAKVLFENIKTDYPTAAKIAQDHISKGHVMSGNMEVYEGYLVYMFYVMDSESQTHQIIVDAGNGKVSDMQTYDNYFPSVGNLPLPEPYPYTDNSGEVPQETR